MRFKFNSSSATCKPYNQKTTLGAIPMALSRRSCFGTAATTVAGTALAARSSATPLMGERPSAVSALDAIVSRGHIVVGISLSTPPYGAINRHGDPEGYDVAVAGLVARELGVQLRIVDLAASDRLGSVTSGRVDVVVSSFTITPERARAVAFSNAVYVDQQVVLGPRSLAARSLADMEAVRVGVTRGTTNDTLLTKCAHSDEAVQRYDTDAGTSEALLTGQVQAIVCSAAFAGAVTTQNAALGLHAKFVIGEAPMAIGLQRGDPVWLHWINTCLFMAWTSRELQGLQQTWMGTANGEQPRFG